MTFEILLLLSLLLAATLFFALEWLPIDVVTLLLLVALILTGVLTPQQAFSGFANEIIVILASVFVISGALVKTGVMEWLGHALYRLAGRTESRVLAAVMGLSAALSAVISNTNSTAILMPATFELSKKSELSPSRLLMPLAYASILGGTCTLIGTSTNIASSGMLQKLGLRPYSLFEFTAVGSVVVAAGILYMATVGHRLLPRFPLSLSEQYEIQDYLSEILLPEGSKLAGRDISQSELTERGVNVVAVVRGSRKIFPGPLTRLAAGDLLLVQAARQQLLELRDSPDLQIATEIELDDSDLVAGDLRLAEAMLMPASSLVGRSLTDLRFRQRYGVAVLALYRRGHAVPSGLRDIPLKEGDVLLIQGPEERLQAVHRDPDLWLLGEVAHLPFRRRKGAVILAALIGAVLLASLGLLPLSVALLLAGLTVVATRCITPQEVYDFIDWRLIVLIGGMTSVGLAMETTRAAELVAGLIVEGAERFGIYAVLATLAGLTMLLTQPLSNAAAALVVLPVALSTAVQLEVNPRTLAVLVTLSASLSFITPFEPACLLVYGPGKYRFSDFLKSGAILTAIAFALLLLLVPVLWPLGG